MNSRDRLIEAIQVAHGLHQAGRHSEAEQAFHKLLESAPDLPLLHNLLGLLYLQTGREAEATSHIRRALEARPDDSQARYNLALALVAQGLNDHAEIELTRVLELTPENFEAMNALGNLKRLNGDLKAALAHLGRARNLAPKHPGILLNSGLAFASAGNHGRAEAYFLAALDENPNIAQALIGLGDLRMAQEQTRSATDAYRAALKAAPSAEAHNKLGIALNALEDAEAAISEFRAALVIDATHPDAALNLAITLEQAGELQAAKQSVRAMIETGSSLGAAYFQLIQVSADGVDDQDLDAMRQAAERAPENETDEDRVLLHYALGHALDRKALYEEAFAAFQKAHELKAKTTRFDLDRHLRQIDWFRSQFTELTELNIDHPPLIFVLGLPRSGTTLTDQILASHPQVKALGERPLIARLAASIENLAGTPFPQAIKTASEHQLRECAQACIETYKSLGNGLVVADTTPINYMFAGLIATLFPQARIVHCTRHPVDTCLSIYQYPLSDAHAYAHDLATLGSYHQAYRRLLAHWRSLIGFRFYDLRYEDLVDHSEQEIRSLLGFCGLDFDPHCLEFYRLERRVRTPSASQVRKPLHRGSVGRWKNYAPYLEPLIANLGSPEG